jgi:hypothetical protein
MNKNFTMEDVIMRKERIVDMLKSATEPLIIAELNGNISALEWVIRCMNENTEQN